MFVDGGGGWGGRGGERAFCRLCVFARGRKVRSEASVGDVCPVRRRRRGGEKRDGLIGYVVKKDSGCSW